MFTGEGLFLVFLLPEECFIGSVYHHLAQQSWTASMTGANVSPVPVLVSDTRDSTSIPSNGRSLGRGKMGFEYGTKYRAPLITCKVSARFAQKAEVDHVLARLSLLTGAVQSLAEILGTLVAPSTETAAW